MSVKVVDHSTGGARIGSALRAAGVSGVIRYAASGRADVNISPGEVRDLKDHGIAIGIVNEHSADYLLGGHSVGKQRAHEAQQIAHSCGLPEGVVYMAGDFDATNGGFTHRGSPGDVNMEKIGQALEGAAESVGKDHVGFYGSYFAIEWLVHHVPWIKYLWQTSAWSERLLHPSANIYQGDFKLHQASFETVGGVSCDVDVALMADWGQRTQRPEHQVKAAGHFNADISYLANTDNWKVDPTKSNDVHFGDEDVLQVALIGIRTGGKNKGKWQIKRMPKNWRPPGGW